jgi:hypothetical protein
MTHEEAFRRLPDLLEDRDDLALLQHVRDCADCQRQLFLLGRIDRALRDSAPTPARTAAVRRAFAVGGALVAVAAAAILLAVFLPAGAHSHAVVLRTAAGRSVGEATITRADRHNVSLTLTAHDLPVNRGRVFVFWAADHQSTMLVGRFMADRQGNCHVRFNLPANHDWSSFWVTRPGATHAMVATGT